MEKIGLGVTTTVDGYVKIMLVDALLQETGVHILYTPVEAATLANAIIRQAGNAAALLGENNE